MATYKAPLRDMKFVLHEMLDMEGALGTLPGYEDASADLVDSILEEGAKVCENAVFPTNAAGDREGCRLADGGVQTPTGFKEAYRTLVEGGWPSLACHPADGGQGMPLVVGMFFEEMLQSANVAFALYPGLTRGAYLGMRENASEALNAVYLPKLASGEWGGVMCLTESHCGTDLGQVRTRAEPVGDGRYLVNGTKIFITGGDQDLTENILHLVLARLPDAPRGVKGISMFLVPKFLVNGDGSLGERNGVACGSLEEKMGIHGASTCVMNYEDAEGYLVGEVHRGLQAMFAMMNHERLMVGQQGLALGEVAYQSATAYARERLQGRSLTGPKFPEQAADPIIVHPDVRRMLLTARANNEAARALLGWVGVHVDLAARHEDAAVREHAEGLVALLTPVVKAYFTDCGSDACNQCLQVLGGHGYIAEWGMEQLVRDARIAQIYEGANGIHALDLVGRKLPMHGGRLIRDYVQIVRDFLEEVRGDADMAEFAEPLAAALTRLEQATEWILRASAADPEVAGSSSYDYLRLLGLTAYGHMWARAAAVSLASLEGDNTGFYGAKLMTARFFMRRLLPQTASLAETVTAASDTVMAMEAEAF